MMTAGIILVLLLFVIRPGANRLRTRLVNSISAALGHSVEVASVHVHLLPRPGFDLEKFVVREDPAFGAEPLLRAEDVTASLRLSSLLHGRLEIARLSLTEPSLNLVRNAQGHWNLEPLLERTAKLQVAPTSKSKGESRPAFPYIEASGGRINFKLGVEKKPYALTDANFSLWQDSENSWGVRLNAQPVRTDFNLSDTGTIRVVGSWQRAATLRETPLQFTFLWERAQLGQLSKLAYGNDRGWRGSVILSATLTGTPANLTAVTDASVRDFRRYDVSGGGELRLALHCGARYSSADDRFSDIACQTPVGNGFVRGEGDLANALTSPTYKFMLTARGVPIQSLVALARHARPGFPDDLSATGQIDGTLTLQRIVTANASTVVWNGSGETSAFHLTSSLTDLTLNSIPLNVSSSPSSKSRRGSLQLTSAQAAQSVAGPYLQIGPSHVVVGRPAAVLLQGSISRSGYDFEVRGEGQLQKLLQAAHLVGLPAVQSAAEGTANVDLQLAGHWFDSTAPRAIGTVHLRSVRAPVRGAKAGVEITSADLTLTPDLVKVQDLSAAWAGTSWHGSLAFERPCAMMGACPVRFDLRADEIATDRLNDLLNPNAQRQPWYQFLSPATPGAPFLLTLNATGKLTANRLLIHKLAANRVTAQVEIKSGKVRLSDLRADVLGGRHTGEWKADFTSKPPQYSGSGAMQRASLGQLATAMSDGWITGVGRATYQVSASGLTAQELLASATGTLRVEASEGTLPHIALGDRTSPVQLHRLTASLFLQDGTFKIEMGKLETADGDYSIAGTASLGRILNLKLTREGAPGFNITGTLADPRVSQVAAPETRAELKP